MPYRKEKRNSHYHNEPESDTVQDQLLDGGLIRYAVDDDGLKYELTEEGIEFFTRHEYTVGAGLKKQTRFWNYFAVLFFVMTMIFCIILKKDNRCDQIIRVNTSKTSAGIMCS